VKQLDRTFLEITMSFILIILVIAEGLLMGIMLMANLLDLMAICFWVFISIIVTLSLKFYIESMGDAKIPNPIDKPKCPICGESGAKLEDKLDDGRYWCHVCGKNVYPDINHPSPRILAGKHLVLENWGKTPRVSKKRYHEKNEVLRDPDHPFMIVKTFVKNQYFQNMYEILNSNHKHGETCAWCGKSLVDLEMDYGPMHGDPCCSIECSEKIDDWIYENIIDPNGEIEEILNDARMQNDGHQ